MNLVDLLAIARRERPSAPALVDMGTGAGALPALGFDGLLRRVDAAAGGLAHLGVAPGDRVALYAEGSAELVVAYLAVLRLGAVAVPVNLAYREREIAHILADASPRMVVVGGADEAGARVEAAAAQTGSRLQILEVGALEVDAPAADEGKPRPPARRPDGSDPALLVYTSGTTGASKGAVLTHDNLLATVTGLLAAWAWRPEDRLLLALPLFHVHGLVVGLFTALAAGASVELHRRFDAAAVVDRLSAGRGPGTGGAAEPAGSPEAAGAPSLFFGVPTMYVRLLRELRRREEAGRPADLSSVRLFASGSAPLAPETFEGFQRSTGHAILERYGMSEAGMILSNPYAGDRLPGTVGVPLPGVSIRIVAPGTLPDEGGPSEATPLPDGEAGEILVRGANVFDGYLDAPEKTAASFVTDRRGRRWFRTGDLARRDPETGHVTLLGRRHELILRGGLNVYPREIEEVLESLPGVAEAAVAGRPDPEYGEVPVAYVVREADAAPEEAAPEAILAACRERLAGFKVPVAVRFVDRLPRNALGKVQKHRLPA